MNEAAPNAVPSAADPVPVEFRLLCEGCGYSLIGLMHTNRCPECGREFDPNELPLARVPWLYRKRLGFIRAYFTTVWQIIVHPRTFAAELCRPVRISPIDARSFRKFTVLLATASAITSFMILIISYILRQRTLNNAQIWGPAWEIVLRAGMIFVGFNLGLWMLLTLATNLPTFIWKGSSERPDDLAPLHHYASAPLALMPLIGIVVLLVGLKTGLLSRRFNERSTEIAAMTLLAAMLILHWSIAAVFMRVATHCTRRRMLGLLVYLPVHWVVMSFAGLMITGIIVAALGHVLRLMGAIT